MIEDKLIDKAVNAAHEKNESLLGQVFNKVGKDADSVVAVLSRLDSAIEADAEEKKDVDARIKANKNALAWAREKYGEWMKRMNIMSVVGTSVREIQRYEPVIGEMEVDVVQVKKGGKFVDFDSLDKNGLMELLEAHGAKFRTEKRKERYEKAGFIKVLR